ncbi:zinc finger CCCH domain-containing protein 11A isoform X2 [Austrofundulus limnaeus]|uniref:Zinc finger CCCH domain-containing protein 11A isoform X2 n=1 Tax=Austrofundulus limnaeus TaxID=52670 RepID=A0A2I4BE70_AUSLI|nr:PREDICTED: zinc finger CCCH domain-containing protein 11A-like isoform X2 [Austrofundulus limnaeus]
MTDHGDDCYFYYYSTCSKGDSCPFRHCEAARGNETVCNLWQEGCCFRSVCKFRHMEITKNRKEIPCYWENQPAGCQKPHCAFFHEKPRYIEGVFVPPSKSVILPGQSIKEEVQHEEPVLPSTPPLTTTANPQLRGVIKTEAQEPVPSPTHPPVVINPADDDEDEDDQFSEEGEENKTGPSPKKIPKSGGSLNFGVSTLEEIRLRKALKASMKKAGYPIQSAETSATREKENIGLFYRTTFSESTGSLDVEEAPKVRVSVAARLGRKIPSTDLKNGEKVPLKRRLGRAVGEEPSSLPPQKALKAVKERLGLSAGLVSVTQTAEADEAPKAPEQIRIKTLEEIKLEKAAKSQDQKDSSSVVAPDTSKTDPSKATKFTKRIITVKVGESLSESLRPKRKQQDEQEKQPSTKKPEQTVEKAPGKNQEEPDPASAPKDVEKVRVKTLEEIRREKAARMQAQQDAPSETKTSNDPENVPKIRRLLCIKKLPAQNNDTPEKSVDGTENKGSAAAPQTSNSIKVKSFEEIMREKRLRKQETGEQLLPSAEASQNQTASGILKRKVPAKSSPASPEPSVTSSTAAPKMSKLTSPQIRTASPDTTAEASVPEGPGSPPHPESQSSSREVPDRNTSTPTPQSSARLSRAAQQAAEVPAGDRPQQTRTTQQPEVSKVRPKLNVRPSVVKPAVQVKPGAKKRGSECSAVAAVKPLSTAAAPEEKPCSLTQEFPASDSEAPLLSARTCSPTSLQDSALSSEDLQTVPVFTQSQKHKAAISITSGKELCAVPQSPVLKSPSQPRTRRSSTAASRASSSADASSAVDDFEELINQFTDDHLEEDVDPAIGEDDLLQELSEMIEN